MKIIHCPLWFGNLIELFLFHTRPTPPTTRVHRLLPFLRQKFHFLTGQKKLRTKPRERCFPTTRHRAIRERSELFFLFNSNNITQTREEFSSLFSLCWDEILWWKKFYTFLSLYKSEEISIFSCCSSSTHTSKSLSDRGNAKDEENLATNIKVFGFSLFLLNFLYFVLLTSDTRHSESQKRPTTDNGELLKMRLNSQLHFRWMNKKARIFERNFNIDSRSLSKAFSFIKCH